MTEGNADATTVGGEDGYSEEATVGSVDADIDGLCESRSVGGVVGLNVEGEEEGL